jgi:hypothetical protein
MNCVTQLRHLIQSVSNLCNASMFHHFMNYEDWTLFCPGVGNMAVSDTADTIIILIITLNYAIFSNYYWYWRVSDCFLSSVMLHSLWTNHLTYIWCIDWFMTYESHCTLDWIKIVKIIRPFFNVAIVV